MTNFYLCGRVRFVAGEGMGVDSRLAPEFLARAVGSHLLAFRVRFAMET